MWTRHHKQRNTGRLSPAELTIAVLTYFGFHALHGEYGVYAKYDYESRVVALKAELDGTRGRRIEFERRVQLLHDGTLDKDMLDEQARRSLNMSRTDEIVIIRDARKSN